MDRAPDHADVTRLVERHRKELIAHCYRILGSLSDAEDAVQDAMVRAWKALPAFEGRSSVRRWLYAIATRTALDVAERRRARTLPLWAGPAGSPTGPLPPPSSDVPWLEPIPDDLIADDAPGPEALLSSRESVALAFLTALQQLPARQRAALILRDVVGMSAQETAEVLETSVPAANSALQRARDTLASQPHAADAVADPALLARFVAAFEQQDADALIAVLKDDAALSMPPTPLWVRGSADIRAFLAGSLFPSPMGIQKLVATRANGGPAFAVYAKGKDGAFVAAALDVVVVREGRVAEIHAFLGADLARFGLSPILAA